MVAVLFTIVFLLCVGLAYLPANESTYVENTFQETLV